MTYLRASTEDATRVNDLFARISENDKNMAIAYLSALVDKTVADGNREQQDKPLTVTT